jgi:hypothetical protein
MSNDGTPLSESPTIHSEVRETLPRTPYLGSVALHVTGMPTMLT